MGYLWKWEISIWEALTWLKQKSPYTNRLKPTKLLLLLRNRPPSLYRDQQEVGVCKLEEVTVIPIQIQVALALNQLPNRLTTRFKELSSAILQSEIGISGVSLSSLVGAAGRF